MKETMAMRAPLLERLEELLDRGGTKKDVALLAVSAVALGFSFFAPETLPFNPAWIAIVLCGAPIILGAVIGLVTEFDIKADVLVSLALIAAVAIGEDFAAGEVALIMQLGALLEDLTVAKARAGIERLRALSAPPGSSPRPGSCICRPARRASCATVWKPSSPPRTCRWETCCACCPAKPWRWTAPSWKDAPPSTSR